MRIHLVLAHPLSDSLNAHLARYVEDRLRLSGADIDVLDLYAERFDPRLTPAERGGYYTISQPEADTAELQARLAAAEALVLVFPTWWFSLPAILKGWIDRIWAPGFAFNHGTPIVPLLTGLRSVLVVTTLGSPWWIDRLVMRQPVRKVLATAIIGACAPQARFEMFSLHAAETVTPERLRRFKQRLDHAADRLSAR